MGFKIPKIEELKEFIESVPNEKYKTILWVGATAGLRIKEIVHLRLQDLDFEQQSIHVSEEGAKYGRSRVVPMCSKLKEILLDYIKKHQHKFKESYIFYAQHKDNSSKTHVTPMTVMVYFNMFFKQSRFYSTYKTAKNGNKMCNWSMHKLRHFYASWLNENKVDLLVISKTLGHRQPSTTLNVYTHIFDDKKSREAVQEAFKDFDKKEGYKPLQEIKIESASLLQAPLIQIREPEFFENKRSDIEKFDCGLI